MAETSGFQTDLPQSAYLALSIERAISLAQQRSHRYVTLEHLLFTMLDDPSAKEILEGLRADIAGIRGNITDAVNRGLTSLYTPGEFDLHASYKVERVLQTASDDADRLNCEDVDASFVITALSRESDSMAAEILKQNGVAYSNAVSWLYANRGSSTPPPRKVAKQSPEPDDDEIGSPPADLPSPSPAARAAVRGRPVKAPADAAPARERYAPEPQPPRTEAQNVPTATAEKSPIPVPSPQPDNTVHAESDVLELDVESVQVQPSKEEKVEVNSLEEPVIEFLDPQPQDVIIRQRQPQGAPPPPPPQAPVERSAPPSRMRTSVKPGNGSYSGYRGGERQQHASAAAAAPAPLPEDGAPEPVPPPVNRLEEMRLNRAQSRGVTQLPAQSKKGNKEGSPKARRSRKTQPAAAKGRVAVLGGQSFPAKRLQRSRNPHDVFTGRLVENVPRKMRAAVAERVEVRISREETQALLRGVEGRGEMKGHDISITQTMSVALRAPDGGFNIEPLSPETQWIFNRPDDSDLYGRWRWVVTPSRRGTRKLQLLIASRSIGPNGNVADSALPDQVITINVRTNYWLRFVKGIQWIAAMIIGGVVTELAILGMRMFGI